MSVTLGEKLAVGLIPGNLEAIKAHSGGNLAIYAPADTGITRRNVLFAATAISAAAFGVSALTDGGVSTAAKIVGTTSVGIAGFAGKRLSESVNWLARIAEHRNAAATTPPAAPAFVPHSGPIQS
ncbi:MAG: hypothetical protein KDK76_01340 [Chlamydiia bacterium]|nr:hypothetical protein [Chlamydiia bacterium]